MWHYWQNGRLWGTGVAGTAVDLGILSDLWMVSLVPILVLLTFQRSRWASIGVCGLAGLPFGLYAGVSLFNHPAIFLFDL